MIRSLRGRIAKAINDKKRVKGFPTYLVRGAENKLAAVNAAAILSDLDSPPGNHLEALGGNREGQHSIRINDQWRVCFIWRDGGADNVEIVDYHD